MGTFKAIRIDKAEKGTTVALTQFDVRYTGKAAHAAAFPEYGINAADALTVAQRNVADYGLADRINLIRSDLFANLSGKTYDLIGLSS